MTATHSADSGQRLNQAALAAMRNTGVHSSAAQSASIQLPNYPRTGLVPSVVHLGLGAFHRAHQALVFDSLLAAGDMRWGLCSVGMRSAQLADDLTAQDGLYAVQIASRAGSAWRVGGAIVQTSVAARERGAVVQAIARPQTRWLTLTVTEKAYDAALAALIVDGLALRHAQGLQGITVASCDNLQNNGRTLQALCVAQAKVHSAALADWVVQQCAFPNSMVDRIVPAATPERLQSAKEALGLEDRCALGTEGFWEWVIERKFVDASDEAALVSQGVLVVDDVLPFEEAKLRMLNASHTAMACIGAVAGLQVIEQCINQPAVLRYVTGLNRLEVSPHVRRPQWQAYLDALIARWQNPALLHSVHQIATDSSIKISQRFPPCILGQLAAGQSIEHLAFAAAAWMRYARGVDEAGASYAVNDPLAQRVQALAREHAGDAVATAQVLGGMSEIWGDSLVSHALWLSRVSHWLQAIQSHGILAATAMCADGV